MKGGDITKKKEYLERVLSTFFQGAFAYLILSAGDVKSMLASAPKGQAALKVIMPLLVGALAAGLSALKNTMYLGSEGGET